MIYEPISLGLINVLFFIFVLRTLPIMISHEATDHFLMFVCHNNVCVDVCCRLPVVLLTVSYFCSCFYTFEEVLLYRTTDVVYILSSSLVHYVINQLCFHALRAFV